MTNPSQLLNRKQVALLCNISIRTVDSWRYRNQGPRYIKLATGTIRYPLNEVLHFLQGYQNKTISQITNEVNKRGTTNEL